MTLSVWHTYQPLPPRIESVVQRSPPRFPNEHQLHLRTSVKRLSKEDLQRFADKWISACAEVKKSSPRVLYILPECDSLSWRSLRHVANVLKQCEPYSMESLEECRVIVKNAWIKMALNFLFLIRPPVVKTTFLYTDNK